MKLQNIVKQIINEGPKGKDPFVFVRFGGLDLKPQKGYTSNLDKKTFHSPPTTRGFYAMPKIAQEFFLISSMDKFQPGIEPKFKEGDDGDKYNKRVNNVLSGIRKEFVKRDGNIWSHLGEHIPNSKIVSRSGSWIKSTIKDWADAFSKMSLKSRMEKDMFGGDVNKSINQTRGIMGGYSKDHCEVFFDEKV